MMIMMVDDDWAFLEILSYLMKKKGYQICTFDDPRECLKWFSDENNKCPDLIISDFMMPYYTGSELLDKIRSGNRCRLIPAVLISSIENMQIDNRLFSKFVRKSNILTELDSVVDQTIGGYLEIT